MTDHKTMYCENVILRVSLNNYYCFWCKVQSIYSENEHDFQNVNYIFSFIFQLRLISLPIVLWLDSETGLQCLFPQWTNKVATTIAFELQSRPISTDEANFASRLTEDFASMSEGRPIQYNSLSI